MPTTPLPPSTFNVNRRPTFVSGSADNMERQLNNARAQGWRPNPTVSQRPSFAYGSADNMERQINRAIDSGWIPGGGRVNGNVAQPNTDGRFSTFTMPAQTSVINIPAMPQYTPAPAALSPQEQAELTNREVAINRLYDDLAAQTESSRQGLYADANVGYNQIARDYASARERAMGELSSRGLALSPAFSGRRQQELANSRAQASAQMQQNMSSQLASLANQVNAADRRRREELASIARMRASYGGDYRKVGV
jgi:hypothetical protein